MAKTAFSGDYIHELPKGRREPYRLWFEYLKFALSDPKQKVNTAFYADWGDVRSAEFDEWWESNWRRLFAVPANVTVIDSVEKLHGLLGNNDVLVVAIHRTGIETQKLLDVKKLLRQRFRGRGRRAQNKPKFEITAKRNVHYPALRSMLRFLELYRGTGKLESAALAHIKRVTAWNKRVEGTMREPSLVPKTLQRFVEEIELRGEDLKQNARAKQSAKYNTAKGDARKFLNQAEKVLRNVASGRFPGEY